MQRIKVPEVMLVMQKNIHLIDPSNHAEVEGPHSHACYNNI